MDIPLTSLHECTLFLESQPPPLIAARVLHDLSLCRTGSGIPSLLVYCLPARADPIALEISKDAPNVPLSVARMRYSSIVANIKSYLATLQHTSLDGDAGSIPTHMVPSDDDYHSTLKVLRYLQLPQIRLKVDGSSGTDQIAAIVQSQLELGPQLRNTPLLTTGTTGTNKDKARQICYICRFKYTNPIVYTSDPYATRAASSISLPLRSPSPPTSTCAEKRPS
ncbi:hypothetical protein APHAL10511_003609 [Amanita phalloides]|nr:hypothetical protein APHAL10511_003609 [Amanita phalloides]